MTKPTTPNGPVSRIDDFIGGLRDLPKAIVKGARRAAQQRGDDDAVKIVDVYGPVLIDSMARTADLLAEGKRRADKVMIEDAERMFSTMASDTLMRQAGEMAASQGSFPRALGMAQIVQLVKKLIDWLIQTFDFGFDWIKKLIDFIDEVLNAMLGGGNSRATHELSLREQDYLKELTALATLEAASVQRVEFSEVTEEF